MLIGLLRAYLSIVHKWLSESKHTTRKPISFPQYFIPFIKDDTLLENFFSVNIILIFVSCTINSSLLSGYSGSKGTYALPDFNIPRIPINTFGFLSIQIPIKVFFDSALPTISLYLSLI